jgi:hypothetical protein
MSFNHRPDLLVRWTERNIVRKIYKRGTVLGALAGVIVLTAAQGASAQTVSPEGIGIEATGTLATIGATPDATAANPNPASVATVNVGLVNASVVSATVNGNNTVAGVAGLTALDVLRISSGVSAGAISSSCTANPDGSFTESSTLVGLKLPGLAAISGNPGVDTSLLGGTVILNQQVAGPVNGSVTVNAAVITLLGETVTIGSSTCGPYVAGAPVAGGKGLAIGGGTLAAAGVGIAAVKLNRRRRPNAA